MKNTSDQLDLETIFIFGALRSGTTVLRLMLSSHGMISNPGEADFLFDCILRDHSSPTGWRYDFDRLLDNRIFTSYSLDIPDKCDGLDLLKHFIHQLESRNAGILTLNVHRNIGKIINIMPHARFIHLLRDPRDVARSSIGMGWAGTVYYGVDHWIETERAWNKAASQIEANRIHGLCYEILFSDVESELRKICNFLDVPYSASMLDYHKTTTYGPPDKSLIEQWRHKLSQYEIGLVEGKAGSMMMARNYVPVSAGIVPGRIEKIRLYFKNKIFIWQHGIKRFGVFYFIAEKLTRWFGMAKIHSKLRRDMNKITIKYLK
jgi:hypothetical protein